MRVIILGSGSTGNALYVEANDTRVLIDAGLTGRETARRMADCGIDPSRLDAVVVTHEHIDHVKGLNVISKTTEAPVFLSPATRGECQFPRGGDGIRWGQAISSNEPFQIGSLDFYPFPVPHDGVDTFGIAIHSAGVKVAMVTDLGFITKLVAERLRACDMIVVESNHDLDMLRVGPYPWSVKQRIASRFGHLSNDETARWIREDFDGRASYLVLAHLSRTCNHPELARLSAIQALDSRGPSFFPGMDTRLMIAAQDRATGWFQF